MTKAQLLQHFPDHKPLVFHCGMDDIIVPEFTYYDRLELEEKLVNQYNSENTQMVLFL